MAVLKRCQERQQEQKRERLARGDIWFDTGKVFTEDDGSWLHPDKVSAAFERILARTGLPPINLRDLRHVAASIIYAQARDIFAVKTVLRHSTIKLAGDTYTSLFTELDRQLADDAANLVPRSPQRTRTARQRLAHSSRTHVGRKAVKTNPARPESSGRAEETAGQTGIATSPTGRPCRTRTDNQRIRRRGGRVMAINTPCRPMPLWLVGAGAA
uniref:Tyr recombinase domain-containing protein n=1 Tax=Streptomyces sp. NBC_00003 TaxID=2903608 RepID=A0AAU2V5N3_9ACTN